MSDSVCRVERKEFINNKYIEHKFARSISMASDGLEELCEAVRTRDLMSVLQLYAEGVELLQPLPDPGKVGCFFFLQVALNLASGPALAWIQSDDLSSVYPSKGSAPEPFKQL